jgi:hypothetical protein
MFGVEANSLSFCVEVFVGTAQLTAVIIQWLEGLLWDRP